MFINLKLFQEKYALINFILVVHQPHARGSFTSDETINKDMVSWLLHSLIRCFCKNLPSFLTDNLSLSISFPGG